MPADPIPAFDDSATNLMVVLRESLGASKQDETLVPWGKVKVREPDGSAIELEMAYFDYLGDMHVRFVFDGEDEMTTATKQDLARLNLTPEAALSLAVANIKRVYGNPSVRPWTASLMEIKSRSPDLDSSYLLDRELWRGLLKQHPDGVVAAVVKWGGLIFAPTAEHQAVAQLRRSVAYLHESSEHLRISSALYLFKDDRWSVFQAPAARP